LKLAKDLYTFLFIFDFASCWERKNPFTLLKGFQKAFNKHDNVQLIIKSVRAFLVPGVLETLRKEAEKTNLFITFVDGDMPFSEVHGLQKYADCYVSPHKGEGLGLTIIDAAYLGKPTIATGFGGNAVLGLNKKLNIKYKLTPIPEGVPAYGGEGKWAEPNVTHLSKLMRWCYENQVEAKQIGEESKDRMFELFNEEKLRKELNINLKRILV
jgi:glycosyltransferase involved in cell wall biosynthesis